MIKKITFVLIYSIMLFAEKPYWPFTLKDAIRLPLRGTQLVFMYVSDRMTDSIKPNPTLALFCHKSAQKVGDISFTFTSSWVASVFNEIDLKKWLPRLCIAAGTYYLISWYSNQDKSLPR